VSLFYLCGICFRIHLILLIFGRSIPAGNVKQTHIHSTVHIVLYVHTIPCKTSDVSECSFAHCSIVHFPLVLSLSWNLAVCSESFNFWHSNLLSKNSLINFLALTPSNLYKFSISGEAVDHVAWTNAVDHAAWTNAHLRENWWMKL